MNKAVPPAPPVPVADFFGGELADADPAIRQAIDAELGRQRHEIELIASENIVSRAVTAGAGLGDDQQVRRRAIPASATNGGCEHVDTAEAAGHRAGLRTVRAACYANVQPHSGAQANQAVFLALIEPGETFMGMDLAAGGHLTHGSPVNQSGKWFDAVTYGVDETTHLIDYGALEEKATACKPTLIIAGGSAYPRVIDFARFREIADKVGAKLMVDMAHISGLVAAGHHPNPLDHADVVTTTTHKTLRGPRGGMILSRDEELGKKFNSAVFPGLQGGPLMHVIAAKAVAFGEALRPGFKDYARQVIENAQRLAEVLGEGGLDLVSGGTDTHVALVDLRPKGVTGKAAEQALGRAAITCNKNAVPFDPASPFVTSGIRLGSPAATTRGFGTEEFAEVGRLILRVVDGLAENGEEGNAAVEEAVSGEVRALTDRFPIYGG